LEEAALEKETPPIAPEVYPVRPTWVALEKAPPSSTELSQRVAAARKRLMADEDDDEARLELARSLWAIGERPEARAEYEELLKSALLDTVIADLETRIAEPPVKEPTLRLLGDAYMKNNQLEEALAAYRRALAIL